MSDLNIDYLLCEWGKWSRGGYGGQASCGLWNNSRKGFAPDISDEIALRIDRAIVACGVDRPDLRYLLQAHYQKGVGLVELQIELRASRTIVDKRMAEAKGYVAGYLDGGLKDAA